jgi:hypothetical protein
MEPVAEETRGLKAEAFTSRGSGMTQPIRAGHRQRLRERFEKEEESAYTAEAILELLLSYAIPQRDLQPLVRELLARFGSLEGVLGTPLDELCEVNGIKSSSAILLKLVDWIRVRPVASSKPRIEIPPPQPEPEVAPSAADEVLLDLEAASLGQPLSGSRGSEKLGGTPAGDTTERAKQAALSVVAATVSSARRRVRGRRTAAEPRMFGKAVLKEAIELLPKLPDTDSLDETRTFLRANLRFSAEKTRQRYANYIIQRMFPEQHADAALRSFARKFEGRQELRDVCYYRFCKAEPLMLEVSDRLILPAIGSGRLTRIRLRELLAERFPGAKSVKDGAQSIVEACVASAIFRADKTVLSFGYREILPASFAFVLHSEFAEPGMYEIRHLEANPAVRALLWNPDRLLTALYELRNQGLVARISEIDDVRQFTTRWTLDRLVDHLPGPRVT